MQVRTNEGVEAQAYLPVGQELGTVEFVNTNGRLGVAALVRIHCRKQGCDSPAYGGIRLYITECIVA